MVGIIGAMDVEVESLIQRMKKEKTCSISGISYHTGEIAGTECSVAQCGVGKVAAAVCAQTMILQWKPSALINVGVAGGIGKDIHIGDLVVSTGLVQHDMDTTALGDPRGWISGLKRVSLPASPPLVETVLSAARRLFGPERVHSGVIATGDQFIGDREKLARIAEKFGACACEMEGGSIAQTCLMGHVPFVVIRAVSDNADEKAAVDFGTFAEKSAHETAGLIAEVLPLVKGCLLKNEDP
mgnify:CR=1 FL=1